MKKFNSMNNNASHPVTSFLYFFFIFHKNIYNSTGTSCIFPLNKIQTLHIKFLEVSEFNNSDITGTQ
jgi:hypothetical protein